MKKDMRMAIEGNKQLHTPSLYLSELFDNQLWETNTEGWGMQLLVSLINPRHACSKATVVVLCVCLCVCLSVCVCVYLLPL